MTNEEKQQAIIEKIKNHPQKAYDYWNGNAAALSAAVAGANSGFSKNTNGGSGSVLLWLLSNWQLAIVGAVALYVLLKR